MTTGFLTFLILGAILVGALIVVGIAEHFTAS